MCATARPQLAKADTAFQAHPLVNRLNGGNAGAISKRRSAVSPAGRPMFEDAPVSVAAGWVAGTLAPHLASLSVLPTDFAA